MVEIAAWGESLDIWNLAVCFSHEQNVASAGPFDELSFRDRVKLVKPGRNMSNSFITIRQLNPISDFFNPDCRLSCPEIKVGGAPDRNHKLCLARLSHLSLISLEINLSTGFSILTNFKLRFISREDFTFSVPSKLLILQPHILGQIHVYYSAIRSLF